ncbi:hypothetical protein BG006_005628, partial [Podila minutissima]
MKNHNKDLEHKVSNSQHTKLMEEFNKDRFIIELGCTLTGSDIKFVKESNNYQGKDCVPFTLLKDIFPIWL